MSSPDADPTPETTPPAPAPALDSTRAMDEARSARRPAVLRLWAVTLAAGLAAGLGSWFLGESIYGRYQPELDTANSFMAPDVTNANAAKVRRATMLEASLTYATLGAVLGLALGLAGGLARGSTRGGLAAAACGLVLGAIGGYGAAGVLAPMHERLLKPVGDDLIVAIIVQGGICAVVGALSGAAFGLGFGGDGRRFDLRAVVGGLLGAVAGLIVYQMGGGIAFPFDDTSLPVSSTWGTRLFARTAVSGFAAVGVALAASADARTR
jgi:hypothetical protein